MLLKLSENEEEKEEQKEELEKGENWDAFTSGWINVYIALYSYLHSYWTVMYRFAPEIPLIHLLFFILQCNIEKI